MPFIKANYVQLGSKLAMVSMASLLAASCGQISTTSARTEIKAQSTQSGAYTLEERDRILSSCAKAMESAMLAPKDEVSRTVRLPDGRDAFQRRFGPYPVQSAMVVIPYEKYRVGDYSGLEVTVIPPNEPTFVTLRKTKQESVGSKTPFAYRDSFAYFPDARKPPSMVEVEYPLTGKSTIAQTSRDGGLRKYDGRWDWGNSHSDQSEVSSYPLVSQMNAVDIIAPIGTPIYAPISGRVVRVTMSHPDIPCPAGFQQLNNGVSIIGDDGVEYSFVHMKKDSSDLRLWQRVKVGELLGRVGTTGVMQPHLHMSAEYMNSQGYRRTIPIRFKACKSGTYKGGEPRNGKVDCGS